MISTSDDPSEVCPGRNGLAQLAVRIFSVIANSAGCERSFSDFGIIHTKHRNHLSPQTVHKTAVLKHAIRRKHAVSGIAPTRHKRKFGFEDPLQTPTPVTPLSFGNTPASASQPHHDPNTIYDRPSSNFNTLSKELVQDSLNSDIQDTIDDDTDFIFPETLAGIMASAASSSSSSVAPLPPGSGPASHILPPAASTASSSRGKTQIPLANLFRYPPMSRSAGQAVAGGSASSTQAVTDATRVSSNFLQAFWEGATYNLEQELTDLEELAASD